MVTCSLPECQTTAGCQCGAQVPARTPIDFLLVEAAAASVKLPALDGDGPFERKARQEIFDSLLAARLLAISDRPNLAETILIDAVLAVANAYPEHAESLALMDAARALVIAVRRGSPEPAPQTWQEKAGIVG